MQEQDKARIQSCSAMVLDSIKLRKAKKNHRASRSSIRVNSEVHQWHIPFQVIRASRSSSPYEAQGPIGRLQFYCSNSYEFFEAPKELGSNGDDDRSKTSLSFFFLTLDGQRVNPLNRNDPPREMKLARTSIGRKFPRIRFLRQAGRAREVTLFLVRRSQNGMGSTRSSIGTPVCTNWMPICHSSSCSNLAYKMVKVGRG